MGLVHAPIELLNVKDLMAYRDGELEEEEVRKVEVEALVDSGAFMLVINDAIRIQLGLQSIGHEAAILADGSQRTLEVVGPVEVRFKNRRTTVDALVVPGKAEVLLGAIPLEGMDVVIDPIRRELILPPDRPYVAQTVLKGILR